MHLLPFLMVSAFLLYVQATLAGMTDFCPDIGPVLAVYLGLFARRDRVATAACFLGLLRGALDFEPSAALILLYFTVAQGCSFMREIVFTERIATQFVVTFAGTALYTLLYHVLGVALPMGALQADSMMWPMAAATISATVLAPPLMSLMRVLRIGP